MTAVQIQGFDELSELVSQEDIVVVQMQTLRSAANSDRLHPGCDRRDRGPSPRPGAGGLSGTEPRSMAGGPRLSSAHRSEI